MTENTLPPDIKVPNTISPGARPRVLIFDVDGTLIDSIELYVTILEEALTRMKLPLLSRDEVINSLACGRPFWDVWGSCCGNYIESISQKVFYRFNLLKGV